MTNLSSVQSLSHVQLFATTWTAACLASLSISNSQSLLMSVDWWCHPTISSSVIPFSSCLQSFLGSGSFPMGQFFTPPPPWTVWKGKKTNLDCVLKSRDISLPTRVRIVKAMVFPVVMNGCKSWTIKKSEVQELMPLNCDAGEDSWESLGLQRYQTSQS